MKTKISAIDHQKVKEPCKCGGTVYRGHMYGDKFIYGESDLNMIFPQNGLPKLFPDGIPPMGPPAKMCARCFRIID